MHKATILICDDEEGIRNYLAKLLKAKGLAVETFADGESLIRRIQAGAEGDADMLLQDVRSPTPTASRFSSRSGNCANPCR